jgi:glycosyltransferase involved in cell wall biosynthesis
MATCNRRHFFPQAVRYFFRQTHVNSELVVIDDGEDSVADLCPKSERVRYIRLTQPTSLGVKLNIGIEQARGDVLQKMDDDDYYHPDFLRRSVENLPAATREHALSAWEAFLLLFLEEPRLRYVGRGLAAGGTLCFGRELWRRHAFRDVPRAVDTGFLQDSQPQIHRIFAPEQYIVVRHGANTWIKERSGADTDGHLRRMPVYPKKLYQVVGRENYEFYRALATGRRNAAPA